jgi:TPR repeat protein
MNNHEDATTQCCADCGVEGDSLKMCKACMHARYCNAECQKKHWPKHKAACKERVAELRDEALFKNPLAKEECPICFLPMPLTLICCMSLPPASVFSVPIYDFAIANMELADKGMETYYLCCGKSICRGCEHSFCMSGNDGKCPFCNSDRASKTDGELVAEMMNRVEVNDAASIYLLADCCYNGLNGLQQDHVKAMELFTKAAELGFSKAHSRLGMLYHDGGNLKKAKLHFEASAMAGHEVARFYLGSLESHSGNMERAVKHWTITASAGCYTAMHELRKAFEQGVISRESIDSTLAAYNDSCAEMRSKARDACINATSEIN